MTAIDYSEVSKHITAESCWVILYGHVYDVTEFLPSHPGGGRVILQLAGKDATSEFDPIHPPGTLEESLPPSAHLGKVNPESLRQQEDMAAPPTPAPTGSPPDVDSLLNLHEVEAVATKMISPKAWGYYYSAADDLFSKSLNNSVYSRILLRPRIFVDCTQYSTSTSILGNKVDVPFFVSPAAMARLAHPSGEHGIARACSKYGAAQIISNNASMTPEQIVEEAGDSQVFGWQLYVQVDRRKSETMLSRINKIPQIKFVVLTLDAPVPGKREDDERSHNIGSSLPIRSAVQEDNSGSKRKPEASLREEKEKKKQGGMGVALFAGTAADLTWTETLQWLQKHTHLPIILKGVQTHEDAYLATLFTPTVRGIILSNHGGRAADTAPPAIHTLLEIRKYCPEVLQKLEVYVDGGIKRGTDIVKALALGAKAVGLGRAPLWGLGVAGQAGVERVLEILKAETETAMRLLGVEKVEDLRIEHVNTRSIERDIYDGPLGFHKLGLWARTRASQLRAKL